MRPEAQPPAPSAPTPGDWASLEAWASAEPGVALQRPLGTLEATLELLGPAGALRLTARSAGVNCRGTLVYLGYPPAMTNGTLWVHRTDLEKTIRPLATKRPHTVASPVIVIDPGHGGDNPGARCTVADALEKELTLDWALRLAPLLTANGWRVVLTRTNDSTVGLTNRVTAADLAGASAFISLHFNSAGTRHEIRGIETYCLTPKGLPSTITRDYEDDASREFPNNAHDEANLLLAFRLQQTLVAECGAADRGVRRARFTTVLRGQLRPAILIEGGFLSNPKEALLITSPAYRQKLAAAVAKALGPAPGTQGEKAARS